MVRRASAADREWTEDERALHLRTSRQVLRRCARPQKAPSSITMAFSATLTHQNAASFTRRTTSLRASTRCACGYLTANISKERTTLEQAELMVAFLSANLTYDGAREPGWQVGRRMAWRTRGG